MVSFEFGHELDPGEGTGPGVSAVVGIECSLRLDWAGGIKIKFEAESEAGRGQWA